jgi:hypothetical protein
MPREKAKQPALKSSVLFGIVTIPPGPKYRFIKLPAKVRRKSPIILRWQFPSTTEISPKPGQLSALPPNSSSPAGREIDERMGHR